MGLRESMLSHGRRQVGSIHGGRTQPVFFIGANATLTLAHSGALIVVTAADVVLTLPATAAGLIFKVVLAAAGLSGGTGLSLSPQAADQIIGNGFTPADDKDAILTGATDRAGDSLTVEADGNLGYYITAVTGTWARQA